MIASIVLNDMDRTHEAAYGYRSWMLQDIDGPYEVILNLCNDRRPYFDDLGADANPNCQKIINELQRPDFFNISAANNIGLHFARGEYVLFANSDIIYPAKYLRTLTSSLTRHRILYALGARVNLLEQQTRALAAPERYSAGSNFDSLVGLEHAPGRRIVLGCSPWIVAREVAFAIGGFDASILCHEDSEFNDRVMHYLQRTGQQSCLPVLIDVYGYHLDHPPSELYDASAKSKEILESRRLRLTADPASEEDTLRTQLFSIDALLRDLHDTRVPEKAGGQQKVTTPPKRGLPSRVLERVRRSIGVLLGAEA